MLYDPGGLDEVAGRAAAPGQQPHQRLGRVQVLPSQGAQGQPEPQLH
ncbi:hypothetical protein ACFXPZ_08015 [Streptomyces sp. NPDC059101]